MEPKQADRISLILEEMVLTGQFKDGERLDEARLAKRFGVSRTPIREALQRLVVSDLAQQLPRRGVFVRQPSSMTLIEMFEMMAEIEGVCSRLAAQRIADTALDRLKQVNAACLRSIAVSDTASYSLHNEQFHQLIYQAAGNGFLENEALRLYRRLKPFRRMQFQMRGRMAASVAEHVTLIDALSAGDASRAAEAARAHVATQGERFYFQMAQIRNNPDFRVAS